MTSDLRESIRDIGLVEEDAAEVFLSGDSACREGTAAESTR